jgi:hypothetical protein
VIKNTSAVRDEGIMNDLEVIDEIMKLEANAVKNNHVKKTNNSVTKGTSNPSINTFTEKSNMLNNNSVNKPDSNVTNSIHNPSINASTERDEGIMNDLEIDEIMKMEANIRKDSSIKRSDSTWPKVPATV